MSTAPKPTLTADELHGLTDYEDRLELVRGYLVREPPVGERHGRVVTRIAFFLEEWSTRTGHGVVLTGDVGFVLARGPDTVRAPDIAVLTAARGAGGGCQTTYHDGPPDLAVEVLAPRDKPHLVKAKIDDYRQAGVKMMWIVDPVARELRVWRASGADEILAAGDVLTALHLLAGFSVPVKRVFQS